MSGARNRIYCQMTATATKTTTEMAISIKCTFCDSHLSARRLYITLRLRSPPHRCQHTHTGTSTTRNCKILYTRYDSLFSLAPRSIGSVSDNRVGTRSAFCFVASALSLAHHYSFNFCVARSRRTNPNTTCYTRSYTHFASITI